MTVIKYLSDVPGVKEMCKSSCCDQLQLLSGPWKARVMEETKTEHSGICEFFL